MTLRVVVQPTVLDPEDVPDNTGTLYPEPFKSLVKGRIRKKLGDALGLKNFGVNLSTLLPGAQSSIRHWHSKQDEFIYVVEGELVLVTNAGKQRLSAGMTAGFPAGKPDGHHLINESGSPACYLEVGDRTVGDEGTYPDDDLKAVKTETGWVFTHKNGKPY
ncbi:MAG: cupin domain-containing protein [Pseudomonadota bacterium]